MKPESDIARVSERKSLIGLAWKIFLPVAIGLGVVVWLFRREFDASVWDSVRFTPSVALGIFLACVFMLGRDFGLSWRFRVLTDRDLSWVKAIKVSYLCEFTSCVTPSAVGGSALSMVYMHREGIGFGRATTITMSTLFLDELFFVVFLPVVMMIVPYGQLFGFDRNSFALGLRAVFWVIYIGLTLWTLILYVGIFVKPHAIRYGIRRIFRLRWLRRWSGKADELGMNMEQTGRDLRHRPLKWWLQAFAATAFSWMSRFLVVCALFLGFAPGADQLMVFARQFVVWVILIVTPTPGGAGVSEWLFTTYYGDLISGEGMALVLALFWRIISYYSYLMVGACILPAWIRQGFRNRRNNKNQ
ncbi:lysylphosphatidylglycerol synthase transmembrane domain-containing protein [uncultured Duncaniella sp.]|uniref:lysylphosphatidylglycerol synthase transmembrane domain-containing protein n=1 Tax=uncultured Duncaniella sp. TaxID=2768039 RepID=UPI0025F6DBC3|nr:lysylphosphatidylglycerol synthase transmembrane domain-containing protein [uncultured Duncaniella sp.]